MPAGMPGRFPVLLGPPGLFGPPVLLGPPGLLGPPVLLGPPALLGPPVLLGPPALLGPLGRFGLPALSLAGGLFVGFSLLIGAPTNSSEFPFC